MSPDALEIILPVAAFINGPFYSQAAHVHQKDARFDPLACRLESGDNDPADALFKKVLWPKRFMRRHWMERYPHGDSNSNYGALPCVLPPAGFQRLGSRP